MRPVSLHLSGFTTFRAPTDIDFRGADLFALTGPTGSGKSSVIDAICFALYGSIPRLSGVAPVVSLGKPEARIRLVFEVEGRVYTVSRLIVRTGDGASQRDVRLEGPDLLVEGVRDVDAGIAALLGLGFEHFTRTVVLPQGRFAAFLEDGPAARERLLKQLLDLGVYEDMRRLAGSHVARLEGELGAVDAQLHDLLVEPEQVDAERSRHGRLEALAERAVEWARADAELIARQAEARRGLEMLKADRTRLVGLRPPDGLAVIGTELTEARAEAEKAARLAEEAEAAADRLVIARQEAGEVAAWARIIEAWDRVRDLGGRVEKGEELSSAARRAQAGRQETLDSATRAEAEAVRILAETERLHAAHVVREGLVVGESCPVCGGEVGSVPESADVEDLEAAREAVRTARAAREAAAAAVAAGEAEIHRLAELLTERRAELASAEAAVAGGPSADEAETARLHAIRLDEEVAAARIRVADARRLQEAAAERLRRAEGAGVTAIEALDRARDLVAGLEPPVPERRDPVADWATLMAWSEEKRGELEGRLEAVGTEVEALGSQLDELRTAVRNEVHEAGIDEPGDDVRVTVGAAAATSAERLARLEADLDKKTTLTGHRTSLEADRRRYAEMARLLRSDRFQQWLLEEAMVGLVDFANTELAHLAGGAYSLAVDGGEFEVIDHRNAEARRSVRTLSGGETFLVSLALALALAERVVATSAIGTARIESMFLDEGFGTLDADTLEVVASVVQELGSDERMVGIVTHVAELASQIPIRFEVRRLPEGSTVTRVET